MFTHCAFCRHPFATNESLEYLRSGRKLAYDPVRGRLWQICRKCQRWTLAPIEERWEALEELEKIVTDSARLLAQTDNVALLRSGDLRIVRVGRAQLREEAWWRYGREFKRRRTRFHVLTAAGVGAAATLGFSGMVAGGFGYYLLYRAAQRVPYIGRRVRFGKTAWQGHTVCPGCGGVLTLLEFDQRENLTLWRTADGLALYHRCATCHERRTEGGFMLPGSEGEYVLRRLLAYNNFAGATGDQLKSATGAILEAGSAERFANRLAEHQVGFGQLQRTEALALEIAANEETERRLLELELAELERRWREEEEIAAIVDRELTPVSGFQRLLGLERG